MAEPQNDMATAPHRDQSGSRTALLIVDMINDLEFPGGDGLRAAALAAAKRISRLRAIAEDANVPVIFINDNFGQWHSEKERLVDHAARDGSAGREMVELLRPKAEDYFVIKPQFSGFYATNLPVLLPKLGVTRLILTGVASDICILFTAADAHMRDYGLWVPSDTIVGTTAERQRWSLELMRQSMAAETRPTADMTLDEWLAGSDEESEPS